MPSPPVVVEFAFMKIDTMNTPLNSVDFSATQLEIPFAQPKRQAIQSETPSSASESNPDLQNEALVLVKTVERQVQEISLQKVQKKKKERVKAAFNLMDYIVKYYNTGETYISRAFTLAGMVSLMMLGANRLTTLEGGLTAFVPPLDSFHPLLGNLPSASLNSSSETPPVSKTIPMESSFERVTRLQPVLVSPSFAPANPTSSANVLASATQEDSASTSPVPGNVSPPPVPVNESVASSLPISVENAPWVSPAPEIPSVSLPLPEVKAPLPTTVQETITVVHQGVQQAADQLNQASPLPEIVPPQPADLETKITEVHQGVQQAAEQIATGQLGQIPSPSIPIGADALPNIPSVPSVPAGIMGIFGGGEDSDND